LMVTSNWLPGPNETGALSRQGSSIRSTVLFELAPDLSTVRHFIRPMEAKASTFSHDQRKMPRSARERSPT
jgi:hypothetical protein